MAIETIKVPDIGGSDNVDVIEILVAVGDTIAVDDSLLVLETDKASMEIPSTVAGKITAVKVKDGDKVSENDVIFEVEVEAGSEDAGDTATDDSATEAPSVSDEPSAEPAAKAESSDKPAQGGTAVETVAVPDIGDAQGVDVIEVSISAGDEIGEGDTMIVLETDKAAMDIPAPSAGKVVKVLVKEGDKLSQGDAICELEVESSAAATAATPEPKPESAPQASSEAATSAATTSSGSPLTADSVEVVNSSEVYAGPAVRKLARQLGVDLKHVNGSGPRSRVSKDDLRNHVKNIVSSSQSGKGAATGGTGIPSIPAVDFAKFGEIETVKMGKIKKLTADNMVRNWLNIPHVTQWDDADITELESFRKGLKAEAEKRGSKLTPLPFLLKACAAALVAEPSFNVSMHHDGESIVHKKYVHIGVAVDTPNGLMVPVIRDVDKKGLWELADDFTALVKKARDGKLTAADMQGGCFTISSLGAMGGNGFTPIVNAPEVAILGVSKAQIKPVWNGSEFVPRNMLPLALSYDHRAINGADAGRFFTYLSAVIADVRRLLL